jgi:transposase-like protein
MEKKSEKKDQINSNYNRHFSEEFRKLKVKELTAGRITVKEMCSLYGISRTTVYNWLYLYTQTEKGVRTVVQMESEATKTKILQQRVAELERIVGQKQLEIDYLKDCFEVATEELGYDIKKKYAPRLWNDSVEPQDQDITG